MKRAARLATPRPEVRVAAGILLIVGSLLISFGVVGCVISPSPADPAIAQSFQLPVAMLIAFAGVVCWLTAFGITRAATVIETRSAVDWRKMDACPMCGGRLSGPECAVCGENLEQVENG